MGCLVSTPKDTGGIRRKPKNVGEVAVFVPGIRVPKPVDFFEPLGDHLSKNLVERLSALRTRVVVMAGQEAPTTRPRRKTATQHGGSTLADLQQAIEDYLPILLGLVKDGTLLQHKVQFVWVNQEDEAEETAISNAWYEVLSLLHLMAMLCMSQANLLLLPKSSADGYQPKVSEESRRAAVDVFLKGAGYLDCAFRHVLPHLSAELRESLPVDLTEGVLRALSLQALGQGVDIQLGMAIDSAKATMAVKRRLACEMVKYWQQVQRIPYILEPKSSAPGIRGSISAPLPSHFQTSIYLQRLCHECVAQGISRQCDDKGAESQENLVNLPLTNGWGEKHEHFVHWKHLEAKAAAYYYHGLILDEGNTEKSHGLAVAALQAADELLRESKKVCETFNTTAPLSKNPPLWGTMKYLCEKIPKDASSKVRINRDLYTHEKIMETAPPLPDFALALKPDEYTLPSVDASWDGEKVKSQPDKIREQA